MGMLNKAIGVYKRYGFTGFMNKLDEKVNSPVRKYTKTASAYAPSEQEKQEQRDHRFLVEPKISIVVPAYETKEQFLIDLFDSLEQQTYDNWELCIADGSASDRVEAFATKKREQYIKEGKRYSIAYKRLDENRGISENTNRGLELVTGNYVGFMDHDDVLEVNALYEVVNVIQEYPLADVIYSDEDKVSYDLKKHTQPHFKTDFNLELLRDNNYICHFLVVSKTLLDKVKGFRSDFDGSQDYDFVLRATEEAQMIRHIPKILYHWRMHSASTAGDSDSKSYTFDAGQNAVREHLKRMGIKAKVEKRIEVGCFHVKYEPLLEHDPEDYIVMMPDNVRPLRDDWQNEFYSYLDQKRVGIVGGKTIDAKGRVRQNGLIVLEDGTVCPAFSGLKENYKGYCRRAVLAQEMSGVSFEFAMIKKEVYEAVGGVDEILPSPYKEIDLCLRIKRAGYAVIQDPYAIAVFDEGKNKRMEPSLVTVDQAKLRVKDDMKREEYAYDPCYNPNFSQNGQTFSL